VRHQTISFIKSGFRIVGYLFLAVDIVSAVLVLVASEAIGIVEEIGHELVDAVITLDFVLERRQAQDDGVIDVDFGEYDE
jgi:hypothetical protein